MSADTPYTPTTEEVRERFVDGFPMDTWAVSRAECGKDFDRWLAQHEAEVKAQALREAAGDSVLGPVPHGWNAHGIESWLRDRADEIEKEAGQ